MKRHKSGIVMNVGTANTHNCLPRSFASDPSASTRHIRTCPSHKVRVRVCESAASAGLHVDGTDCFQRISVRHGRRSPSRMKASDGETRTETLVEFALSPFLSTVAPTGCPSESAQALPHRDHRPARCPGFPATGHLQPRLRLRAPARPCCETLQGLRVPRWCKHAREHMQAQRCGSRGAAKHGVADALSFGAAAGAPVGPCTGAGTYRKEPWLARQRIAVRLWGQRVRCDRRGVRNRNRPPAARARRCFARAHVGRYLGLCHWPKRTQAKFGHELLDTNEKKNNYRERPRSLEKEGW